MAQNDPPICSDCRHYQSDYGKCWHPDLTRFDPIYGRVGVIAESQRSPQRAHGFDGCGPDGKRFEAPPPPSLLRKMAAWAVVLSLPLGVAACGFITR